MEALRFLESPERTLVAAALQFLLANPAVSCAIPGASRPQRLDEYMKAYATTLTAEELARIDEITSPKVLERSA
jgi:myo-inositol catabolism protein IolS